MQRVRGIVANASRCSHAELDEAKVLDDGDPIELGKQLAEMRRRFHISTSLAVAVAQKCVICKALRETLFFKTDVRCAAEIW